MMKTEYAKKGGCLQRDCYTSVNRGSVAKCLNKGISIEHSCESP